MRLQKSKYNYSVICIPKTTNLFNTTVHYEFSQSVITMIFFQVCRVAYEMMQTMHGDASSKFKSLDDIFYFGGQNAHNEVVVEKHVGQSSQEIDLEPGDLIGIAGNHWDGYS